MGYPPGTNMAKRRLPGTKCYSKEKLEESEKNRAATGVGSLKPPPMWGIGNCRNLGNFPVPPSIRKLKPGQPGQAGQTRP
jgi:hypothetical protein